MLSLPTVAYGDNAVATQFSTGHDHWSQARTYQDFYFILLSALSANPKDHKEILYYFCFPEYKLKIPVRSAELIFLILPSCTPVTTANILAHIFIKHV